MNARYTQSTQALVVLFLTLLPSLVWAQSVQFRRPFESTYRINYGFDNDSSRNDGQCTDYKCGSRCYDGHRGTDYGTPVGTPIMAAAHGIVKSTHNGCPDFGSKGDSCGGYYGNHVRVEHAGGDITIYAHFKLDTVQVQPGQVVSCGDVLGMSASSGNSTGPHLHFEWRDNGAKTDPYQGACTMTSPSAWTSQGANGDPGAMCDNTCACTPGDVETIACGLCGQTTRTCLQNCQWGANAPCSDAGACKPGAVESERCGDCGYRERECSESCEYQSWGACRGKDPVGPDAQCDTGMQGICAAGQYRCIDGVLNCAMIAEPEEERCDTVDSNCDGNLNEPATTLGKEPPAFAAKIISSSFPSQTKAGAVVMGAVEVLNMGTSTWMPGAISLQNPANAEQPDLYHDSWQSRDVIASNTAAVAPGEVATFSFSLTLPAWDDAVTTDAEQISASFALLDPNDDPIACPRPVFAYQVNIEKPDPPAQPPQVPTPPVTTQPANGCQSGGGAPVHMVWWCLMVLGFLRRWVISRR